jgi:hypothetical protein
MGALRAILRNLRNFIRKFKCVAWTKPQDAKHRRAFPPFSRRRALAGHGTPQNIACELFKMMAG